MVPAATTLLITIDRSVTDVEQLSRRVSTICVGTCHRVTTGEVEIPVVYEGEDLPEVARLTGLDERGVIEAHTGTPWTVAFCGFAPGFGYMVGGDERRRCHVATTLGPRSVACCRWDQHRPAHRSSTSPLWRHPLPARSACAWPPDPARTGSCLLPSAR